MKLKRKMGIFKSDEDCPFDSLFFVVIKMEQSKCEGKANQGEQ